MSILDYYKVESKPCTNLGHFIFHAMRVSEYFDNQTAHNADFRYSLQAISHESVLFALTTYCKWHSKTNMAFIESVMRIYGIASALCWSIWNEI